MNKLILLLSIIYAKNIKYIRRSKNQSINKIVQYKRPLAIIGGIISATAAGIYYYIGQKSVKHIDGITFENLPPIYTSNYFLKLEKRSQNECFDELLMSADQFTFIKQDQFTYTGSYNPDPEEYPENTVYNEYKLYPIHQKSLSESVYPLLKAAGDTERIRSFVHHLPLLIYLYYKKIIVSTLSATHAEITIDLSTIDMLKIIYLQYYDKDMEQYDKDCNIIWSRYHCDTKFEFLQTHLFMMILHPLLSKNLKDYIGAFATNNRAIAVNIIVSNDDTALHPLPSEPLKGYIMTFKANNRAIAVNIITLNDDTHDIDTDKICGNDLVEQNPQYAPTDISNTILANIPQDCLDNLKITIKKIKFSPKHQTYSSS